MPVAAEGYPQDGSTPTSPRSVPGCGPNRGSSMSGHPRTVPYHSQTLLGMTGTSKAGWRSLTRSSHPPWTSIQPRVFFSVANIYRGTYVSSHPVLCTPGDPGRGPALSSTSCYQLFQMLAFQFFHHHNRLATEWWNLQTLSLLLGQV